MNTLILGLPRNGKGLFTCQQAIDELSQGDRCIVGNFAFEKLPWRTRKHELRCGLLSYLDQKFSDTFNAQERIFRISDDATAHFFLYRGLSRKTIKKLEAAGDYLKGYRVVTPEDGILSPLEFYLHKDFVLHVCDHVIVKDKNGRDVLKSFDPLLLEHSGAHLNIADECWKFWPARSWQSTSEADVFYNAQHGKFGDDNLFVTHRHNDLDSVIVDRCQTSIVLTHHGKMHWGKWRRPDVYEAAIYSGRPMPSKEPMSTKTFRLDAVGIGACYDTSSGVGVTGGGTADRGGRKTGLPFWTLIALIAVGVAIVGGLLIKGPHFVMSLFLHKPKVHQVAPAGPANSPAQEKSSMPTFRKKEDLTIPAAAAGTDENTDDVYCVGFTMLGGSPQAFLSDGSTVTIEDGLTKVAKHYIILDGRKISIHPKPEPEYVARPVTIWPQPPAAGPRPVNDAEILPAIHSRFIPETPRLNGFSSMRSAPQPQGSSPAGTEIASPPLP
jgi:hypothetical protein